jgi:hypothetical protein
MSQAGILPLAGKRNKSVEAIGKKNAALRDAIELDGGRV